MFRSAVVARIARNAFENAVERKNTVAGIQNIIRCSLTEFDKGIEEYRVFRETHDTPDWGVVRMSSIAMAQNRITEAENILKEQMDEYGGAARRQARNVNVSDEQICASIERVLRKDEPSAIQFFHFLKKYKFCSNRDVFLSLIVKYTVQKHGWKTGIERIHDLMEGDKRAKSMKMCAYYILEDAWKAGKSDEAESVIFKTEVVKASTLRSLQLFIRLCDLPILEIADFCKRNSILLTHEDVNFIIDMAGKLKYPMPLLNLLEVNQFINLPESSFYQIFDELIKLAGKSGKVENLEEMMHKIKRTRYVTGAQKSIFYGKIRHFYKCLNVLAPEKLNYLIRKESFC
uniref:Uncharacterized protein n=1 Tax=Caenorhabditis japonica TaxID=281687 RepID=A0A8R1DM94_CAEJA